MSFSGYMSSNMSVCKWRDEAFGSHFLIHISLFASHFAGWMIFCPFLSRLVVAMVPWFPLLTPEFQIFVFVSICCVVHFCSISVGVPVLWFPSTHGYFLVHSELGSRACLLSEQPDVTSRFDEPWALC